MKNSQMLAIGGLLLYGAASFAAEPFAPQPNEIALLPPLCQDKLVSRNNESWTATIGPEYLHIHHYCYALNFLNRASRKLGDRPARQSDLSQALDNIDYVIRNSRREFMLLPEILVQKGKVLRELGRIGESVAVYQEAIQIKPDYAAAYTALSEAYQKTGNRDQALQVAEEGLKNAPDSKALSRRVKELKK